MSDTRGATFDLVFLCEYDESSCLSRFFENAIDAEVLNLMNLMALLHVYDIAYSHSVYVRVVRYVCVCGWFVCIPTYVTNKPSSHIQTTGKCKHGFYVKLSFYI